MNTEALELLIEQLRSANLALQGQVETLTKQLAEKGEEGESQAKPQSQEPRGDGGGTPHADAALELLLQKQEAAKAAELAYVEPLRARGLSIGTASDFEKYKAARG